MRQPPDYSMTALGWLVSAPRWSIGLIALFFVFILTAVIVWRRSSFRFTLVNWTPINFARELSWLAVPVVVTSLFGFIVAHNAPSRWSSLTTRDDSSKVAIESKSVLTPAIATSFENPSTALANRPKWTGTERSNDGMIERIVLTSGQYSSADEARGELMPKAFDLVRRDLTRFNSMGDWSSNWQPVLADVRRYAVAKEYLEAVDTDFVTFQHPMYRVWWQVELSPAVRNRFLPSWRKETAADRVVCVAAVICSLTLAATLLRVYPRIHQRTRFPGRVALNSVTAIVISLWIFVARIAVQF